jgi:serine/threonine protein kinase
MATQPGVRTLNQAVSRQDSTDGRARRRSSVLAAPTAAFSVCRFGSYRLIEQIDRSTADAPAEMYRAFWAKAPGEPEQPCVLKRLRAELVSSPTFVRMFEEETRVLAALHHPNIVQTYDHGVIDGVPYLAMESLDGVDLARLERALQANGKLLPVEVAVYIAHEVAVGLAHAHGACDSEGRSLRLVHRDLKPGNVILLSSGAVKLVQFGVARVSSFLSNNLTSDGLRAGKPVYVAPEQIKGAPLDARADLFSLGVLLWEMLTGRPLFPPSSPRKAAARLMVAELKEPSALRTDVLEPLDALVMRLLDRDVNRRYQSAAELATDLARLLPAPADDVRALCSLVRNHLDTRTTPKPILRPGSRRPITRVVPVVAAALARGMQMKQIMSQMTNRIPGSIRRVTGFLPAIAARLPGRKTTTSPQVVPHGSAKNGPVGLAMVPPLWNVPDGLPRRMAVLALQTLLAVTVMFVIGVGWRELRASAHQPVQIASDDTGGHGVVIERLPAAVVIPSAAATETAPERKSVTRERAGSARSRLGITKRGAAPKSGPMRARRAHARPKSGA